MTIFTRTDLEVKVTACFSRLIKKVWKRASVAERKQIVAMMQSLLAEMDMEVQGNGKSEPRL